MKAILKSTSLLGMSLATVSLLSACGPKTPDQLILGTWEQTETISMSERGANMVLSDASTTYKKDGSSEGQATMSVSLGQGETMRFVMTGEGTWSLTDGGLVEKATNAEIETDSDQDMAKMISAQMQQEIKNAPASNSEIIKLTKDELIVRDKQTDITMTYRRK